MTKTCTGDSVTHAHIDTMSVTNQNQRLHDPNSWLVALRMLQLVLVDSRKGGNKKSVIKQPKQSLPADQEGGSLARSLVRSKQ
mmetsp:Transcript_5429/g.21230  ORF Transcript_5429/g.21230 Transcript_5429/m.21230 type:complete len:83 (-) Transcript_5429:1410-1658(-)